MSSQIPFSSEPLALLIVQSRERGDVAVRLNLSECLTQAKRLHRLCRSGTRFALIAYDGLSYAPCGKWIYEPPRRRKGRKNVVSRKVR